MNNVERASNFKVPRNMKSRHHRMPSRVAFKNLTNDSVLLYWIDYTGRLQLYGELNPMNRADDGFAIATYVSHPWVAILPEMEMALFNGKKYFFPPDQKQWMKKENGWMNSKWNLLLQSGDDNIIEVVDQEKIHKMDGQQNEEQQFADQLDDEQQIDDQLDDEQQIEDQLDDEQQIDDEENEVQQIIDDQQNEQQINEEHFEVLITLPGIMQVHIFVKIFAVFIFWLFPRIKFHKI